MLRVLQICKAPVVSTILAAFAVAALGADPPAQTWPSDRGAVSPVRVSSFGRLPLTFEKNTGRYDKRVKFMTRTGGATVFVTANEMVMVLPAKARRQSVVGARQPQGRPSAAGHDPGSGRLAHPNSKGEPPGMERSSLNASGDRPGASPLPPRSHVLRMKLVGSNSKSVATGLQKQPGIVNYFIGNDPTKWRTRVPTYAKAKLAGVYPGIDLVYYGVSGERREVSGKAVATRHSPLATHLEYDFIIKPGADPRRIQLAFEGADRIRVADGDLILSTPAGDVRLKRPYAYQVVGGRRVQVACDYTLQRQTAALRVARYDASEPLVVDPVLWYSTFLGGSDGDSGSSIAVDSSGAAYVTGYTYSTDFPTTAGAFDTTLDGGYRSAFVTRLNPSGSAPVYSTFLGGSDFDGGDSLTVDAAGAAYVTGYTESSDFPTTAGAFDTTFNGLWDAFVTKLDPSGSALVYSTFLGGSNNDEGYTIAVDASGAAYVTGPTYSSDFPTTAGAFDTTFDGDYQADAFVTKLHPSGLALVYSTFLGMSDYDEGFGVAVDGSGAAYVAGRTRSFDFPTTAGAFDTTFNGGDAFVAKLNPLGSALVYSTFLGGGDIETAYSIAVDSSGAAYITGDTWSSDFPTTVGAFDTTFNGGYWDAFVTKLDPSGSALVYSTFLGGSAREYTYGIAVDSSGAAYVAGYTRSFDFPTTLGAFDTTFSGNRDAFATKLNASGSALVYSTFLGGSGYDTGTSLAVDSSGAAYVTGVTDSSDFPTTPGAFDTTFDGDDAFVATLVLSQPLVTNTYTLDRVGTIGELTILRGYLTRTSDGAKLDGKSVEFSIDGTAVGSAVTGATGSSGRADLNWVITDGPGTRTILAEFAGDAAHVGSSDTATLTAQTWQTKMSGSDREGKITAYRILKAWLYRLDNSPVAGKGIAFKLDGTLLGTDNTRATGLAQIGYTIADGAGAGIRQIRAEWAGDGGYLASSCTNTLNVLKATPYIWVMPRSVPEGGVARLYAYFRRLADYQKQVGKTVSFRIDGTWIADAVTGSGLDAGIARHNYTTIEPPGGHTIRCEFAGDAWVDAGYGEGNLTIY